jgi:hypothetical protein
MARDIAHAAWFTRALADAADEYVAHATDDPVADAAIAYGICCRVATEYIQRFVEPEIARRRFVAKIDSL